MITAWRGPLGVQGFHHVSGDRLADPGWDAYRVVPGRRAHPPKGPSRLRARWVTLGGGPRFFWVPLPELKSCLGHARCVSRGGQVGAAQWWRTFDGRGLWPRVGSGAHRPYVPSGNKGGGRAPRGPRGPLRGVQGDPTPRRPCSVGRGERERATISTSTPTHVPVVISDT